MYNKKFLLVIFSLLLSFCYFMGIGISSEANGKLGSSDGGLLLEAFNASGVELEQMTLHHGGELDDSLSFEEGRETLDQLLRLYTWSQVNLSEERDAVHPTLEVSGKWNEETTGRVKLTFLKDKSGVTSTYLNVSVYTTEGTYQSMDGIQERIAVILQQFDTLPQINSCLQGFVGDTLDVDSQLALIGTIEKQLAMETVEEVQLENVISKSGYSPLIDRSIITGNRPMNLQVATHVDRKEGRTVVTVGTPIITIEY